MHGKVEAPSSPATPMPPTDMSSSTSPSSCWQVAVPLRALSAIHSYLSYYQAFLKAIAHACVEIPMPVLAYCLMPNHFHLVVLPANDGDLSVWMHWLQNTHVRRYHKHHGTSGHVWQGRFKAFPIQEDGHLLTVLRYVERNPVRAKLVRLAQRWPWSSARLLARKRGASEFPGERPGGLAAKLARMGQ